MSSELLKLNILMKAEHPAFMLRQALSLKAVAQVVAEAAVNNAFKIPILSIGIFYCIVFTLYWVLKSTLIIFPASNFDTESSFSLSDSPGAYPFKIHFSEVL